MILGLAIEVLLGTYRYAVFRPKDHGGQDGGDTAETDRFLLVPELPQDPYHVIVDFRVFAHGKGAQIFGDPEAAGENNGRVVVGVQVLVGGNQEY